ncbi:chromatin-remodeling complex subunit [Carex rostrata]|uniref:INO80 complex subunit C n=1 Tax=Carex littledalei TaxID=544730 RepID=A0A833QYN3_9POAL|nr:INO80 complex subunit C [Carex littledalei]
MEPDVVRSELVLPPVMPFKKVQTGDKYPKGQSRARYWKHLKQLLQAENFLSLPPDEPNYLNIEAPPSMYPPKKYCDITGFEAPYVDPRTKLRYADPEVFRQVRNLPNEHVQRYLALRNAAVIFR